ncbi:MAG: GNAT family N-acetyltransferase [Actinobacteria bacterium]|nr:MAG: GNAT family N-acetyltransferase [Actinomycetota bacterium]
MTSSPPEFGVRPVRPDDDVAVHALMAAYDTHFQADIGVSLDDLGEAWSRTDLERNAFVWERGGRLAAYASVRLRGERLEVDGYVDPDFFALGFGTAILETTEARARELGAAKLTNAVLVADHAAVELLEAHAYRDMRHFYRMTIDMTERPPVAQWPEGLDPRPFEPAHAEAFHAADDEAFQDEWDHVPESFEEFRRRRLESPRFDPSLWTAVWDGDEIAATLIADRNRFGAGWIGGLGVRGPWRRRGLGLALLLRSFGQFYERGERRVSLGVDAENPTGATRLYERAGMRVVWEFAVYEKELVGAL